MGGYHKVYILFTLLTIKGFNFWFGWEDWPL